MIRQVVKYLAGGSGLSLFAITVFAPTTLVPVKYFFIAIFLPCFTVYILMRRTLRIDLVPIAIATTTVFVGIIWILYGVFRGNPGATSTVTVYLLYPLLFALLSVTAITSYKIVYSIQIILLTVLGCILIYTYIYIGHSAGIIPAFVYVPLPLQQNIGFYDGFVEYTMDNLASLLFLVPYLLTAAVIWPNDTEHLPSKQLIWGLLLFSVPLLFLSGRRAFQLVVILSVPIVGSLWLLLPKFDRQKRWPRLKPISLIFCGGAICLFVVLELTVLNTVDVVHRIVAIFGPLTSIGESARIRQFFAMMEGIHRRPLFGYGFGSVVQGVIRSSSQPWAYELMYVKVLYDVGLLGFLPYLIGFIWLCRRNIILIQTGSILGYHTAPLFVGMFSFIIASASNPYLSKFGYMWVIFIPVGVVHFASAYSPRAATTQLLTEKNEDNE